MATANNTAAPRRQRTARSAANPPEAAIFPCIHLLDDRGKRIVQRAIKVLEESAVYRTEAINSPSCVRAYLTLRFAGLAREEFRALWLDSQYRIIAFDLVSTGTLASTQVHPREVVKAGLAHNAADVIFAHNHPSGVPEPSSADIRLTSELKAALALVDIRVLDHFIVAGNTVRSFLR